MAGDADLLVRVGTRRNRDLECGQPGADNALDRRRGLLTPTRRRPLHQPDTWRHPGNESLVGLRDDGRWERNRDRLAHED
jgi:hypothetical protein